jgi:hypothetical protein
VNGFARWLRVVLRGQWDRVAAWVAVGVGALVLLLGWLGVSRTAFPAEQIPYIVSAGIGGIFLLGLGALLWISADLRDEWRKLDRIEDALAAVAAQGEPLELDLTAGGPTRARRRRAAAPS